MKRVYEIMLAAVAFFATTAPVYAFGFDSVKEWVSGAALTGVLALVGAVLAIGAVAGWVLYASALLTALGTLCLNAGVALSDKKITKEELATFKADVSALVTAAKTKPGA